MKTTAKVVLIVVLILATIAALTVGGFRLVFRPQGEAQAADWSQVNLSADMLDATVLAVGEATHGNHELQALRTEIVDKTYDHGFRAIVLEEDFGSTAKVNEYIQGGPGTAGQAAQQFGFAINKTQEVADWLDHLRMLNDDAPADSKIHLFGMDAQRIDANKEIALGALESIDPGLATKLNSELSEMTDQAHFDQKDLSGMQPALDNLGDALSTSGDYEAQSAADALSDYLTIQASPDYNYGRDKVMFDNLVDRVSHVEELGIEHVILLAHDGHVSKSANGAILEPVGMLASEHWHNKYKALGTDFFRSHFLANSRDGRTGFSVTVRSPLRGIYEGTDVGYLDFGDASATNKALVERTQPMGSAGEMFSTLQEFVPLLNRVFVVPAQSYDALIYYQKLTPVSMLD